MHRMLHVRERVPLRRRLRIEVVEEVVEHEFRIRENLDGVRMLAAGEQRRVGDVDRQIQCEHFARSNRVGRLDHAIGRQQVDGADFVVVAEHAPRRTRRRACADREFVVAGESWRRGIRRAASRESRGPQLRRPFAPQPVPSVRPRSRNRRMRAWRRSRRRQLAVLTRREIFFGAVFFEALTATVRLAPFDDAGFFRLTALGATLRALGAAFFIFFLGLANGRDLLDCSIATASSH